MKAVSEKKHESRSWSLSGPGRSRRGFRREILLLVLLTAALLSSAGCGAKEQPAPQEDAQHPPGPARSLFLFHDESPCEGK